MYLDADCGAGFVLIENVCVNVTMETGPGDALEELCTASGHSLFDMTMITDSTALQVCKILNDLLCLLTMFIGLCYHAFIWANPVWKC